MMRWSPRSGHNREREGPAVLVAPCRIVYRRDETEVIILAVHHARRQLDESGPLCSLHNDGASRGTLVVCAYVSIRIGT